MLTFFELRIKTQNEEESLKLAQQWGLRWKNPVYCEIDSCGFTKDTSKVRHGTHTIFRCNNRSGLKHYFNFCKNTVFDGSHLAFSGSLRLIYCFSTNVGVSEASLQCRVNHETAVFLVPKIT